VFLPTHARRPTAPDGLPGVGPVLRAGAGCHPIGAIPAAAAARGIGVLLAAAIGPAQTGSWSGLGGSAQQRRRGRMLAGLAQHLDVQERRACRRPAGAGWRCGGSPPARCGPLAALRDRLAERRNCRGQRPRRHLLGFKGPARCRRGQGRHPELAQELDLAIGDFARAALDVDRRPAAGRRRRIGGGRRLGFGLSCSGPGANRGQRGGGRRRPARTAGPGRPGRSPVRAAWTGSRCAARWSRRWPSWLRRSPSRPCGGRQVLVGTAGTAHRRGGVGLSGGPDPGRDRRSLAEPAGPAGRPGRTGAPAPGRPGRRPA
jgi:hypothetical protein